MIKDKTSLKIQSATLELLRGAVTQCEHYDSFEKLSHDEWTSLFKFCCSHGISSILLSEIDKLETSQRPPSDIAIKWIGKKLRQESLYYSQYNAACDFANVLQGKGIQCFILKGLALASYYPSPCEREFGDIDCYLIKGTTSASELGNAIAEMVGAKVEPAGYKHSHIYYKKHLFENHKYFTNFNQTKQGTKIEKILRRLSVGQKVRQIDETSMWMPSPEFNLIFILMHSLGDFIAGDLPLRALLDWSFFLTKEKDNIDWSYVRPILDECKLMNFFSLITEICVSFLDADLGELYYEPHPSLAQKALTDILNKSLNSSGQLSLWQKIPNILKRFRRQYMYRTIVTESFTTLVLNTFLYSSFLHRKVSLE